MHFFMNLAQRVASQEKGDETTFEVNDWLHSLELRNQQVRALRAITTVPIRGEDVGGALAGVPIVLKDLIHVATLPTGAGSKAVQIEPSRHSEVAQRVLDAGAVIVAKSHTTEFALSGWGAGPCGRPLNAIDATDSYYSGGSSNGSAAAVAAGLVAAAIGTDTGGSVRIPSSWCGLTGLKGSPGWVSTDGVLPLSQSFDTVGPITRTVADAIALYRAMISPEHCKKLDSDLHEDSNKTLPTLLFLESESLQPIDPEVLAAYQAAQVHCQSVGFTIETVSLPTSFNELARVWVGISSVEAYLNNQHLADDPNSAIDESTRLSLLAGKEVDLSTYFNLLNVAHQYRKSFDELLVNGRILVVPTTSTPAVPLGQFDPQRVLGIFTRFVNLIQGCSVAVPNGLTADQRPTSMQFVSSFGNDALILKAALYWQKKTNWHEVLAAKHQEEMRSLFEV